MEAGTRLMLSGFFGLIVAMFLIYIMIDSSSPESLKSQQCLDKFAQMHSFIGNNMSSAEKRGFCGCIAHAAVTSGTQYPDENDADACIDQYMRAAIDKRCAEIARGFRDGRMSCTCFFDHIRTAMLHHMDAAQSNRSITDAEKEDEDNFSECVN